jgi:hypothetical protein
MFPMVRKTHPDVDAVRTSETSVYYNDGSVSQMALSTFSAPWEPEISLNESLVYWIWILLN